MGPLHAEGSAASRAISRFPHGPATIFREAAEHVYGMPWHAAVLKIAKTQEEIETGLERERQSRREGYEEAIAVREAGRLGRKELEAEALANKLHCQACRP
jgi:hypothetical protein